MNKELMIEVVLNRWEGYRQASLWNRPRLRPRPWLMNFDESDRHVAAWLLDRFVFFTSHATDRLLIAAFEQMEADQHLGLLPSDFLNACNFVGIAGEVPNIVDSGNLFCRRLRNLLDISDDRFVTLADAIDGAKAGIPVVLMDDLIATGSQFEATWRRQANVTPGAPSLKSIALLNPNLAVVCLAPIITVRGCELIKREAPGIRVYATHVLEVADSPYHGLMTPPRHPSWSPSKDELDAFLAKYSSELIFDNSDMPVKPANRKFGYKSMALALGFEHGSGPDGALPIFWAKSSNPNWRSLVEHTV